MIVGIASALLIFILASPAGAQGYSSREPAAPSDSYWKKFALGAGVSLLAHESAHILTALALGFHPYISFDKGRPTVFSGIDSQRYPHKQFLFSAAGLTTQALIDEAILDIPHARGGAIERGILAGGIGTTLFYITLGRNGAVSDIAFMARTSSSGLFTFLRPADGERVGNRVQLLILAAALAIATEQAGGLSGRVASLLVHYAPTYLRSNQSTSNCLSLNATEASPGRRKLRRWQLTYWDLSPVQLRLPELQYPVPTSQEISFGLSSVREATGARLMEPGLFGEAYDRASRQLPVIGEQKDIRYYSSPARSVLNGPETTGMGFWSINPYIGCAFGCAYCYARYTHRYVMERAATDEKMTDVLGEAYNRLPPWLAFERNIFVKRNAPEVLSRTLRFGSDRHLKLLDGETIVIGTATDPYQPAERRFRVTRGILEVLAEHPGLSVVIITKSPLITRDIDLLSRINRLSHLTIHISLITLDRELARRIEPRSPTPESRVRALTRLREAGIDAKRESMQESTACRCCPALLTTRLIWRRW